jgi:hypothetical protein
LTLHELIKDFNAKTASIGWAVRIEDVIHKDEGCVILKCTGTACIRCKTEEDIQSCQVITYMFSECVKDGIKVYCILLDLFTKCGPDAVNHLLKRLGHIDRSIDLNGRRTSTGKYDLSVRPDNPTKGLVSWFIKKL